MPIYAYRCADCGHAQDFLQKISDGPIAQCPSCGSKNFAKQVTAAGFQLKGGGWYVTDFRDSGKKDGKKSESGAGTSETKTDSKPAETTTSSTTTTTSSDSGSKPAASPQA